MNRENRHDLRVLWRWIDGQTSTTSYDFCSIVDVLAHEDSPPTLFTRRHTLDFELLAALRQPPEHVCVQVVIWPIVQRISRRTLDLFGLGLGIDPQFFLALMETLRGPQQSDPLNDAVETRLLRPSHAVIDRAVATFVRHYPLNKPATAPIVLIACDANGRGIGSSAQLWDITCATAQRINDSPPFTNPRHHGDLAPRLPFNRSPNLKWLHIYRETQSAWWIQS